MTRRKTHKTNEAVLDKRRWTSGAALGEDELDSALERELAALGPSCLKGNVLTRLGANKYKLGDKRVFTTKASIDDNMCISNNTIAILMLCVYLCSGGGGGNFASQVFMKLTGRSVTVRDGGSYVKLDFWVEDLGRKISF